MDLQAHWSMNMGQDSIITGLLKASVFISGSQHPLGTSVCSTPTSNNARGLAICPCPQYTDTSKEGLEKGP